MESNKVVVRRVFEELFSHKNPSLADQLYAANHVYHDPGVPGLPNGPEGIKILVTSFITGFPDIKMAVLDIVAEGDRTATRWVGRGTNTGALMGMPITGKAVEVFGTTVNRLEGGKIVETWAAWDNMGMLQQMGIIPTPGK